MIIHRQPLGFSTAAPWLVFGALGIIGAVADDDPKTALAPIKLTIRLPADAELEIAGKKMDGSGELRRESIIPTKEVETPYAIRATWAECDTKRTVKRSLRLTPGQEVDVDLNLELNADEKTILSLINKEREKAGLGPLSPDHKLNRAARSHSLNMAKQNTLDHVLDGMDPNDRIKATGYRLFSYGENVGVGPRTPAAAVQMWMNSPPHKQNILTAEFTETGLGIASAKAGQKYYTQVFTIPAKK